MEEYKDISRGLKMLLGKAEEMGWNWEAYIEPDNANMAFISRTM